MNTVHCTVLDWVLKKVDGFANLFICGFEKVMGFANRFIFGLSLVNHLTLAFTLSQNWDFGLIPLIFQESESR